VLIRYVFVGRSFLEFYSGHLITVQSWNGRWYAFASGTMCYQGSNQARN